MGAEILGILIKCRIMLSILQLCCLSMFTAPFIGAYNMIREGWPASEGPPFFVFDRTVGIGYDRRLNECLQPVAGHV